MELPKYRSHKIVEAAKIVAMDQLHATAEVALSLETPDGGRLRVDVPDAWRHKHEPYLGASLVGGYFVRYADGYESWSPAKAFEGGYEPYHVTNTGGEKG